MTDNDKRLEQVFADPQYKKYASEIRQLRKERYEYCAKKVDKTWMQGAAASDPADQPRVDEIDARTATLRELIEGIYAKYGTERPEEE